MQKVLNKTVRGKEGRKADVYCFWSMVIKKKQNIGKRKSCLSIANHVLSSYAVSRWDLFLSCECAVSVGMCYHYVVEQ